MDTYHSLLLFGNGKLLGNVIPYSTIPAHTVKHVVVVYMNTMFMQMCCLSNSSCCVHTQGTALNQITAQSSSLPSCLCGRLSPTCVAHTYTHLASHTQWGERGKERHTYRMRDRDKDMPIAHTYTAHRHTPTYTCSEARWSNGTRCCMTAS